MALPMPNTRGLISAGANILSGAAREGEVRGRGIASIGAGIGQGLQNLSAKRERAEVRKQDQANRDRAMAMSEQRLENQRLLGAYKMLEDEAAPIRANLEKLQRIAPLTDNPDQYAPLIEKAQQKLTPIEKRMQSLRAQMLVGATRVATGRGKPDT